MRRSEHFDLTEAQQKVESYLKHVVLPEGDLTFWEAFAKGEYRPELLFDDADILARIAKHPMALWKCSKKTKE